MKPNDFPHDLESAKAFLREEAGRVSRDPMTNSVTTLAQTWFSALEAGAAKMSDVARLSSDVHVRLAKARADRFRAQHADGDVAAAWAPVRAALEREAAGGFDAFREAVERPRGGVVFTAHPTFAQSPDVRAALALYAEAPSKASEAALTKVFKADQRTWNASITLKGEHGEAQAALRHAAGGARAYASLVLEVARARFPNQWRKLRPSVPTLASWVGYDLDGRTDIFWWQSIALRLAEKSAQLARYADTLQAMRARVNQTAKIDALIDTLTAAAHLASQQADLFCADLSRADALVAAANALTADAPGRLTQASVIRTAVEDLLADAPDDVAHDLMVLIAEIDALQLGTARIHLRVNAAQVQTVLARDLGLETEDRELGRLAIRELAVKIRKAEAVAVNFADLFLEQSTARRQFMMCAQILKHIDAGSPIRFLIAESENPATVMGALYLAKLYGADQSIDISPLFETPEALETGGRFIERLIEEPAFTDYVRARGYLSIQLGFSDSGRFIGQIAGNMAIERIHNLIVRALSRRGLGVGLLIFNTHGESLGRGGWPGNFAGRFDHLLSPWTRARAHKDGVALRHETSFQGGDGYLHFATPGLAQASYAAVNAHLLQPPEMPAKDEFYIRTDLVWDFYRALRGWHERLFVNADYGALLSGFALGLTVNAGSRQRKRPSGRGGPRDLRAISHNGVLQQLGLLVNSAGGIGSSLQREGERLAALISVSQRMRHLLTLAIRARVLTSVPAVRAYASVYDPSAWVALARQKDGAAAAAYRSVYYVLRDDETAMAIERIANHVAIDLARFDRLMAKVPDAPTVDHRHEERLDLHVLHALRQALMMRAFALVARVPRISERHDVSQRDLMRMVMELRFGEATALLARIFPMSAALPEAFAQLTETGSGAGASGYDRIHRDVIKPLEDIDLHLHAISLALTHAHDAYG